MDLKGYFEVVGALERSGINANVAPKPEEGEDTQFVYISVDEGMISGPGVVGALREAGLYADGNIHNPDTDTRLSLFGLQWVTELRFKDMSVTGEVSQQQ